MPTRPRVRLAVAAATAAALVTVPLTLSANASVPPPDSGWTLAWSDDFTGPAGSLPDQGKWTIDTGYGYPGGPGNWGTGEIQEYTANPANIALDGSGNLRITPLRDGSGKWTSARIETKRADFKPPAGGVLRIEANIRMPDIGGREALGYWPAFWALGSPYRGNYWNWPAIGEFDIMENVNGIDSVWAVLHCGVNPGGPCNETDGLPAHRPCPGSSCQSAPHKYRFEWDASVSPQELRWYVDGQQYHTIRQDRFDATTWANMTSHSGYFLLLNLAIGGAFPNNNSGIGTPVPETRPGVPLIADYVAVWTRGGTGTPPTTTTTTTTNPPTTTTQPPGGGGSAYSRIEAESFAAQSGVSTATTTDTGGGRSIGSIGNGDWTRYARVDFGSDGARQFQARVASGAPAGVSGLVEVRIGSRTAPPVGSFAVGNTGGWQSWRTIPANISHVTGVHDVYLTFASGQPANYVDVNWFTFARS